MTATITAKTFILVARCVANVDSDKTRAKLANELADEFEKANDRFNRDKFLKACNVPPTFPMIGKE